MSSVRFSHRLKGLVTPARPATVRSRATRPPAAPRPHFRPALEGLETRTLLTTNFVVPLNVATDATHFHDLSSAIGASNAHDVIQIEPNSAPGAADGFNTMAINKALTIKGDPSDGPANLPLVGPITIAANGVTLDDLNLGDIALNNGLVETTIANSLVGSISQTSGFMIGSSTALRNNTFTGTVFLGGGSAGSSGDQIVNNTFQITASSGLELAIEGGAVIQGNTFVSNTSGVVGIQLDEGGSASIVGNKITLADGGTGIFIGAVLSKFDSSGTIANNVIDTGGLGTGMQLNKDSGISNFNYSIAGNDFVRNLVGVVVTGDDTPGNNAFGNIDLGGGTLGSSGGNDFHGFTGSGGHFSVTTTNGELPPVATTASISALDNIFSVAPSSTTNAQQGAINAGTYPAPTSSYVFVSQLYSDFLHRAASVGELAGWVNALPALGTAGVATGILRSPEADARLVDALYLKILGRAADPAGETGWVNLLEQGASEEQVAAAFLSSPEFAARAAMLATAPASPNLDRTYIDALYAVLLGRTASAGEIGGWLGVLPALGRSGVAKAFMGSVEFRGDVIGSLYFSSAPMQLVPLAGIAPNLLHRTAAASAAETAGWVNSGMDILSIEVAFAGLSGGEFFNDG